MDILEQYMPQIVEGYCSKSSKPREIAEEEVKEYLKVIEDASSYMFNYSHSVAYCLLGYYYGYFRHYHPLEFITSYLNNAANDEDIKTGTAYANRVGIKITMPKWGISKSDYFYDTEKNIIAKGLSSIKYMNVKIAEELYELANSENFTSFFDLLTAITNRTSLDTRQLDILIKIDFFSQFGNQRELLRMTDLFLGLFKKGSAKQILREKLKGSALDEIVRRHSEWTTKSGDESKSYRLTDISQIMRETEELIHNLHMSDLDLKTKLMNFNDIMGYFGYSTGRQEDMRKLYVTSKYPIKRKKDGKICGYNITTRSLGSGKEAKFSVFNNVYSRDPFEQNDIIYITDWESEPKYKSFNLLGFKRLDWIELDK